MEARDAASTALNRREDEGVEKAGPGMSEEEEMAKERVEDLDTHHRRVRQEAWQMITAKASMIRREEKKAKAEERKADRPNIRAFNAMRARMRGEVPLREEEEEEQSEVVEEKEEPLRLVKSEGSPSSKPIERVVSKSVTKPGEKTSPSKVTVTPKSTPAETNEKSSSRSLYLTPRRPFRRRLKLNLSRRLPHRRSL